MTIELIFDLSLVDSQHSKEKKYSNFNENVDNDEESSTESTFYGEDCKALEALFDDNSSMCSCSSSEGSMASCEYEGTYTRTFGDEDSLVLVKGRYLHEEPELQEVDEEQDTHVLSFKTKSILKGLNFSEPNSELPCDCC